jgi:cysteine-rich repeat protein
MAIRFLVLLTLTTLACFDARLPSTNVSPSLTCGQKADCPDELPICTEQEKRCVAANTPCRDADGKTSPDGNECGGGRSICIGGTCTEAACGDGFVSFDEPCDDSNDVNTDGCLTCVVAKCGDGFAEDVVEDCDGGPDCDENCRFVPCTTGEQRCNNNVVEFCSGPSFIPLANCSNLQATCVQLGYSFCESTADAPCFDGVERSYCEDSVCLIDSVIRGTCRAGTCDAVQGSCAGSLFQERCFQGNENVVIDCAGLGATCVDGVGCVLSSGQACINAQTRCDIGGGRIEVCTPASVCPEAFNDGDGSTRLTPIEQALPATTTFDISPGIDEDCVQFSIVEPEIVSFSTSMLTAENCGVVGGNPSLVVLDASDKVIFDNDDASPSDFCVGGQTALVAGTYRACVVSSPFGPRGDLFDVALRIDVAAVPDIALPFRETFNLTSDPECFPFRLDAPRRVTVDAGIDDSRCLPDRAGNPPTIDTVAKIGAERVDDNGVDFCAVLTTDLPAGKHIACVSSYDPEDAVEVAIRFEP